MISAPGCRKCIAEAAKYFASHGQGNVSDHDYSPNHQDTHGRVYGQKASPQFDSKTEELGSGYDYCKPFFLRDLKWCLIFLLQQLHGRSREQRYTKSADWNYIDECAQLADPIPLYGNGDILSYDDYKNHQEMCKNLSGMILVQQFN